MTKSFVPLDDLVLPSKRAACEGGPLAEWAAETLAVYAPAARRTPPRGALKMGPIRAAMPAIGLERRSFRPVRGRRDPGPVVADPEAPWPVVRLLGDFDTSRPATAPASIWWS